MDYEEMILARQESRDEDYDEDAPIMCNRRLEDVYPFLFNLSRQGR